MISEVVVSSSTLDDRGVSSLLADRSGTDSSLRVGSAVVASSLPELRRITAFLEREAASINSNPLFFDGLPSDLFDFPLEDIKPLQKFILEAGIEAVVENPCRLMNGLPGSNFTRSVIMNVNQCLLQLGMPIRYENVDVANTFDLRKITPKQIRFAFHSADLSGVETPGIIRIKESYLPPYYTFDATGFSGWASLANNSSLFEKCYEMDGPSSFEFVYSLRRAMSAGLSKYAQPQSAEPAIEGPYVLYPMQISTDSVMQLARIDPYELLESLVSLAKETGTKLVIKRHPRCKNKKTQELLQEIESNKDIPVVISAAPISQLICGSQAVVVVNSGTGMETLIHGKPLYCSGFSDYQYLANQISDLKNLRSAFTEPQSAADPLIAAQFINYYFNHYCISASKPRQIQQKVFALIENWVQRNLH